MKLTEAQKEQRRIWRKQNPEKMHGYKRKWNAKHPEHLHFVPVNEEAV